MLDAAIISFVVKNPKAFGKLQRKGITEDHFVDQYRTIWVHLCKSKQQHDAIPSPDALSLRFPDIDYMNVRGSDMPQLVGQLKKRKRFIDFLTALNNAASSATDYDQVDDVIQQLLGRINSIAFGTGDSHLVELFSPAVRKRMEKELHDRRSGRIVGIPTGLQRFDDIAGGLQKQKMVTLIGRTSTGKSWLNLLFVAKAVMDGRRVILYPLEMSLTETAFRLYTIFSQQMFGANKVFKNYDLTTGKVSTQKLVRFLHLLEDRFKGQLYVADVGSLGDPYTNERIEAEVDSHHPDMFWVDYLTLLKAPSSSGGGDDWQAVRQLSHGIKSIAMRRDTVGGASAQVNREAIRSGVFLPRLEHISFGDSIGHDSDQVITINKKGLEMFYALVKNRGGPEIGATRVRAHVNEGIFEELGAGDEEDDD